MHKKANLLSIWWFFMLALIGAGIVAGTMIFYSADIDVRQAESDILALKISDCIKDNEIMQQNFNIFEKCNLKKEIFELESRFFVKIQLKDGDKILKKIIIGDASLESNCNLVLGEKIKGTNLPKCTSKSQIINKLNLEILTASNQFGKIKPII